MNNVVKNIIWNAGYQVFAILMPLLTIPYVSRILGSETLGKATTVTSFSAFLGIAISMGLYQFGPRPIAQNENNKRELAQSFFSLWKAQLLVGLVLILGYSLYYLRHDLLYLTQIPYLVGIALDISWFYIGLGHVKKIVIRNMAVRLIGFAFVFVFVKSSKDVTLYLLIISISQLIANATFLIGLNKKIDWTLWYNTKMYSLKFLLVVMIPQIAVQVYTTLDKPIMNLFAGYTEVAYYDQSQKIARIAISLITSLSMIIMPVMAKLDQSDNNKLNKLFEVSFDFTLLHFSYVYSCCYCNFRAICSMVFRRIFRRHDSKHDAGFNYYCVCLFGRSYRKSIRHGERINKSLFVTILFRSCLSRDSISVIGNTNGGHGSNGWNSPY